MPHFPKHLDVGDHCHLALWLTKFKRERDDSDRVISPWTLSQIFTSPLIDQPIGIPGTLGVLSEAKRRILEAAAAAPKDSQGTPYINPAKAMNIRDIIEDYENAPGADADKSFVHFFLHAPKAREAQLFKDLCKNGLYIPPAHHSPDAAELTDLLVTHPMWNERFPDPLGGDDLTLGTVTYEIVFGTPARLLYNRYRATFDVLRRARDNGIIRAYEFNVNTRCPAPHVPVVVRSEEDFQIRNKTNGMCCRNNNCEDSGGVPSYCELTTSGYCNAMSDICQP